MANKNISQLPAATEMLSSDLLVLEQNGVAKKMTGTVLLDMIDSHGGIASTSYTAPVSPSLEGTLTITFTDGTSTSVPIMNGAKGNTGATGQNGTSPTATVSKSGGTVTISITDVNGTTTATVSDGQNGTNGTNGTNGNPGYCWIKYASVEPTSDEDMGDLPDAWMGVYSGSSSTAPTTYTSYKWYNIKGATGAKGNKGDDGANGARIWMSTSPAVTIDGNQYLLASDLVSPYHGVTPSPWEGDIILYGDGFYTVTGLMIFNPRAYLVSGSYQFNNAAIPSGGQNGYYLGKLSDNDYDIGWIAGSGGGGTPYTSNPSMDGVASPGSSNNFSRGDHVHPSDTSKQAKITASGILKGDGNGGVTAATAGTDYLVTAPVTSVNGQTGAVSLSIPSTAADVGAIAAPSSPTSGQFLVYNGSAWVAMSLSTWQGGSY